MEIEKLTAVLEDPFENVSMHFLFHNGREERKAVSYSDFIRCFHEAGIERKSWRRIGPLPDGFYDGVIDGSTDESFKVVLAVPKRQHIMNYYGDSFIIPYPDMVFFLEVNDRQLHKSLVVALDIGKSGEITNDALVCKYPFGNVYGNFGICWGSNILPEVPTLKDTTIIVERFLSSETNMDLYQAPTEYPEFQNQRGLIEALVKLDEFPAVFLNQTSMKLKEMILSFLN